MRVTLDNVGLRYPGAQHNAVQNINLTIHDGEFLVLVGPSGCGKSTTLRMLAGLEMPTEGSVHFDDTDVTLTPAAERDIAMVFQNYALYPHMTVAGNMEFALKNAKIPKAERAERIQRAATLLDIDQYLDRKPRQLSGGQRQRVAMGRAIVRNPQVFLMDEPLSNLDAKLRVQTRGQILQLQRNLGVTTVYVTHDQTEAMTMGDRVVVMNNGHIEQVGRPKDLYNRPETLFVAGFIGSPTMNLLPGILETTGGTDRRVRIGRNLIPVPTNLEFNHDHVVVGVRPEDLFVPAEISSDDDTDTDQLTMNIDLVESVGSDTYVYGSVHGAPNGAQLVARIGKDQEPAAGERITLVADPQRVLFFDTKTQQLIGTGA